MTDQADEIAAIAGKLTAAQQRAILWMSAGGSPRVHEKGSEVSFFCLSKVIKGDPRSQIATIYSLCERGQGERVPGRMWPPATWKLTPLGIAVRNHLKESS